MTILKVVLLFFKNFWIEIFCDRYSQDIKDHPITQTLNRLYALLGESIVSYSETIPNIGPILTRAQVHNNNLAVFTVKKLKMTGKRHHQLFLLLTIFLSINQTVNSFLGPKKTKRTKSGTKYKSNDPVHLVVNKVR